MGKQEQERLKQQSEEPSVCEPVINPINKTGRERQNSLSKSSNTSFCTKMTIR